MAVLRCPVPSFVADYVRVTSWERVDGFLITPGIISGKYGMLENGDLYFRDVTERDTAYSFRCHTENLVTREKKVSMNYSKIVVTEPHHNQPPRIIRRSNRVVVVAGQRTTLSCIAQGHPVPTYRWHRLVGSQHLPSEIGPTVRKEGGVLIFNKAVRTDSGKYSCQISNIMGEDRVDMELFVEEPLQVSLSPQEQQLDVGKTAHFNCSIEGHPIGSITWKKDTKFIIGNSRIQFPTPTSLQLRQLKRQDSGMYQCFVQRESFSSQAAARLIIGDLTPQFKLVFPEKTVRPGSYVSLMCIANGNPAPQVKWTLDNIWTLSTRPGVLVSTYLSNGGDVISYVNITSTDVTDSGVYTCTAFNEAGSAKHSRRLNVFGSLFIRPLSNLTALAGGLFRVMCPFGGYPFESIVWKREGRILPTNQRQEVFQNGTLLITDVQPEIDDGLYSCEVRSQQGVPVSRTFRIIVRTGPKIASFGFRENLHEGMRTAVTCIVVAGDGPLTTNWLKNGRPLDEIELDAMVVYADDGFVSTLTLKNLAYKHNGNYTCVAKNDVASGAYSATLVVKVPPRWIIEPTDISAVAGRPAKIDCQADGVPLPHVRWKLSTGEPPEKFKTIVSSSHVHILVNGSLNFRSVEASDAGFYLCEANNGVGAGLSTVVRLSVHSAPQFHSKYTTMTSRRGERTVMECKVYGDMPVSFSWKKNGVLLDPLTETRYAQELPQGGQTRLVIEKVEKKDSALYTCTGTNDFGEDSKNIQLTIQDTPDAPQSTEVHDVSSRSVRVSWSKPFDGNSPITQYTVMWRQLASQSVGGPLTVPGSETTVVIRGLKPKNRYFFRVKCENSLGESQFGAEVAVTTLEEPPRKAPYGVRALPLSSRSLNVTWQVSGEDEHDSIDGFYVGYKQHSKAETYNFKAINVSHSVTHSCIILGLLPMTDYSIIVQAFNGRGPGPPSEPTLVRTLEFDRPRAAVIKTYYATSKTIKLSWDPQHAPNAPISGYILHHRMEGKDWNEVHLTGDRTTYTLQDLQCGTPYYFFLVAFNSAGHGNSSETITAKTDGTAPITPEKYRLLTVNSTSVSINLNSWNNGGCPISYFIIQYKLNGQQEWTLVSNNIIPEQQNITITDLSPGSWYTLLMTAKNDAGTTDAEYSFASLTLSGERPPHPSEMSDVNSSFYRHLTITVPVISSAIVLIVVLCAVCFITRRRTTDRIQTMPDGADESEAIKPESVPLSVTYDSSQEPAYYPAPYGSTRVPNYSEHCIQNPNVNQKNMGTFGSGRTGYTYDIPYPPRRPEKSESKYETPAIYFPAYHHTGVELLSHRERVIYSVADCSREKREKKNLWKESGDDNSSTESDTEDIVYAVHSSDDRIVRDEARESETECDRLWKTYESCQYEDTKRWSAEHAVLS
ncbi:LOW QUALITY PROTEIN: cell adhesion molecule Dscam2-like [Uloborus diversus]|uniref:LOW QUALITY PROTEIN: cell adhesion molecule Dscam2-like n=1 Tax=Uloborus diversus TaxID=327109 RepID=UPI002409178B|nr:LOW QUALITY PROTEIN: cell adhesion molecule Dscam2-like [Uloborus diversus]